MRASTFLLLSLLTVTSYANDTAPPKTMMEMKEIPLVEAEMQANDGLRLLPEEFELIGPNSRQRLLVEIVREGRIAGQLNHGFEIASSNPCVVAIEDGVVVPQGNGEALLTVRAGDQSATAQVSVRDVDRPFEPSFRIHVQAVLTKAGCNSGACHGALAGKNGFKLSLRGYDADGDYSYITRQSRGRRIVPSDPGQSLILTKPTGAVPHKGGKRFDVDSESYRVLAQWIAQGTRPPKPDDATLDRLEILPSSARLVPGMRQRLVVRAHYSGGRQDDVSSYCMFTSANESVASVDTTGLVKVTGNGEGAVSAIYLGKIAIASISAPYPTQPPPEVFADAPRRNFIDEIVLEKLESLNIPPSPMATDEEFLRRAYLDTIGVLPTVAETREFLADSSPDKRDRLIEELLERPEFVDYWAYKWSDLLLVNGGRLSGPAMWSYYRWIRNNVAANTPWDQFARSLITSTGSTLENGATNFFVLHKDPTKIAENASMAFMGMSIECAKCHNHPLEKWTNDQYYGMANLFARVRKKDLAGDGSVLVYTTDDGNLIQPRTGKPQPPRPLDADAVSLDGEENRREVFADWLTSPDNPYFARAVTNRVWKNFLGVGLVENVDDLRQTNPASNEELLSAAAHYLIEHEYDLKALMRAILESATYQRSSGAIVGNEADERFYSRYYPKRLMAEVMLDAISQATGSPTQFPGYPDGWRSLQLPDANVASYFLTSFGRPVRELTCSCERTDEPSVAQVLHLANGDAINAKLSRDKNRVSELLAANTETAAIVEEVFLAALCRYPTDDEKARIVPAIDESDDRRAAVEDLYWSVLSTKEFLFSH
jgi:hypothetical protein